MMEQELLMGERENREGIKSGGKAKNIDVL